MSSLTIYCTFEHLEQAVPSPSTCSALPTSPWSNRPRNRSPLPAPCTLRETATWLVLFLFCFRTCCFCDFSLSCSWQKGDRPDNDFVEPRSIQTKKRKTQWSVYGLSDCLTIILLSKIVGSLARNDHCGSFFCENCPKPPVLDMTFINPHQVSGVQHVGHHTQNFWSHVCQRRCSFDLEGFSKFLG